MLATLVLDERDLVVAKINDEITKIKAIDMKKKNEEKTADGRLSVEEFTDTTKSA